MWGNGYESTISKTHYRLLVEMLYIPLQMLLRILRWVFCTLFIGYGDFLLSHLVIFFLSLAASTYLIHNRLSFIIVVSLNTAIIFMCRLLVRHFENEDLGVLLHVLFLLILSGFCLLI